MQTSIQCRQQTLATERSRSQTSHVNSSLPPPSSLPSLLNLVVDYRITLDRICIKKDRSANGFFAFARL